MAVPVPQALGTVVETTGASLSVPWPAHQAGDIGLLFMETDSNIMTLDTLAGFREAMPVARLSNRTSVSYGAFAIWWSRADSGSMPNPVIRNNQGHIRARIATIRGASPSGNPITFSKEGWQDSDITGVAFPAGVTADADSLVLMAVATNRDIASSAQVGSWANSDLTNVTEWFDSWGTVAGGSGFGAATGEKAVAGAFGAGSAVLAGAHRHLTGVLVISSASKPADNDAYIANYGPAAFSSSADVTPHFPAHSAGDLALMLVHSGGTGVTLADAQGFAETPDSPQNDGPSGDVSFSGLSTWWKRCTGSDVAPTVNFVSNNLMARIIIIKNVTPSGTPFNVTAGNVAGSSVSTISIPGDTTTIARALVLAIGSLGHSSESQQNQVSLANADLAGFTLRHQEDIAVGSGAGIHFGSGVKVAAGAFGNTTGNISTGGSRQGRITLAIIPVTVVAGPSPLEAETMFGAGTIQPALLLAERRVAAETMLAAGQMFDANFAIVITYLLQADPMLAESILNDVTFRIARGRWETVPVVAEKVWAKRTPES